MRRVASALCLILAGALLSSCASFKSTTTTGTPLDLSKLKEVQTGVTDLRAILEWFGPPEQIIDGTQEILDDQARLMPGVPIATRTLSAPEGAVILLYSNQRRADSSMVMTGTPVGAAGKDRYTVHSNEMMIFIRKRDHKVVNVLVGEPTDERP